ncbi:single-stranded DNA-binding protein [Thiomicrorhabdus hydrogeniphila]
MFIAHASGSLGKDSVLRSVPSSKGAISVLNFSLAAKSKKKGQDNKPQTIWIDCSLWGVRAESLAQYLTKGTIVSVSGEPGVDSFESQQNGTVLKQTLTIEEIQMLGGGNRPANGQQNSAPQNNVAQGSGYQQPAQQQPMGNQNYQSAMPGANVGFENDDVPFSNYELRTLA